MSMPTVSYNPFTSRVRVVLDTLRRETATGKPATAAYHTLCVALRIPTELRAQLLRLLVAEGYVTEEAGGQVRLTAAGARLVAPTRP
jgi:hypothetical protein